MSTEIPKEMQGEVVFRSVAMPADTNANGDVFGGWILSQMDLGGSILAKQFSGQRVVTVALDGLSFLHPVKVGDIVTCYANLLKVGTTSMKVDVATWVCRYHTRENYLVTHGVFTYVAIDDNNRPMPIKGSLPKK